jgi:hypothetical protein
MFCTSFLEKDVVAKSKRSPVKKRQSLKTKNMFSAECVATSTSVKGIFEYYTGLTYARFLMLTNFLFPTTEINPVKYEKKRKEVQNMDLSQHIQLKTYFWSLMTVVFSQVTFYFLLQRLFQQH